MKRISHISTIVAGVLLATATVAGAATLTPGQRVTYTNTITISAAPPSSFSGGSGGDGWAIAVSPTSIFNVYHHAATFNVDCHVRATGAECTNYPLHVSDGATEFFTSMEPSMYFDQVTQKLYAYALNVSTTQSGVVCVDTTNTASPFCGFTALAASGSTSRTSGIYQPYLSNSVIVGTKFYAFNGFDGVSSGDSNTLLCFDVSTGAACASQPYSLGLSGIHASHTRNADGALALIAGKIYARVPLTAYPPTAGELICFDPTTNATCGGNYPLSLASPVNPSYNQIFPLANTSGTVTGLCLHNIDGSMSCWNLDGTTATEPAGMGVTFPIAGDSDYLSQPLLIGTKVYATSSNNYNSSVNNNLNCYDFATSASCASFPYTFQNMDLLYTLNQDPVDQNCLWINSNGGSSQIQDVNVSNLQPCGTGALASLNKSAIIGADRVCDPTGYLTVTVTSPAASTYQNGKVYFYNASATRIGSVNLVNGTANIQSLNLQNHGFTSLSADLPGQNANPMSVKVDWYGTYSPSCTQNGQIATAGVKLASTGSNSGSILLISALLVLVGAGSMYSVRRRRNA